MYKRTSKYNAKKTEVDGIKFDSKAEADFYGYLKYLKKSKMISSVERQKRIVILPSYEIEGRKVRAVHYIADFVITYIDGEVEYVDVKGYETDIFKLKKKMFESMYGTSLRKARKVKGEWKIE